jgi:hypothetical protein
MNESALYNRPMQPLPARRSVPYPLYALSGVFVALFAAFFPLQNFLTSVLSGADGFVALAVLYGTFCLATNVAPAIVQRLGLKPAMAYSASLYTILHFAVAFAASGNRRLAPRPVVMLTAAGCGFGAAVLWTAQGAYCVAIAQHYPAQVTIERAQSFFMSVNSASGILGFAAALLLIDGFGFADVAVMWAMACLSLLAVAAYAVFLPPLSTLIDPAKEDEEVARSAAAAATTTTTNTITVAGAVAAAAASLSSTCRKFGDMLRLFRRRDVCLVAVSVLHLGCQEGLFWGVVARAMGGHSSSLLVRSFLLHGVASLVACALSGSKWLEDKEKVMVKEKEIAAADSSTSTTTGAGEGGATRERWWLSGEGKTAALVLVSVLGQVMAAIALGAGSSNNDDDNDDDVNDGNGDNGSNNDNNNDDSSSGGSGGETTAALLLLLGTVCFGFSDFAAQALLRAAIGELFAGSPLLEAACSGVLFTLTLGNIVLFCVAGLVPEGRAPPRWQAAVVASLGFLSLGCLAARHRVRRCEQQQQQQQLGTSDHAAVVVTMGAAPAALLPAGAAANEQTVAESSL